jgi:hypothetical protein
MVMVAIFPAGQGDLVHALASTLMVSIVWAAEDGARIL